VIVVGLTGGIGSGKSTVAGGFVDRGARLIDADAITRSLQEPGQPVLAAMVQRFGAGIVTADGMLNRAAVAAQVFDDADALADLNRIVHPAVRAEIERQLAGLAGAAQVVVLDIPLLAEGQKGSQARRYPMDGVIVVDAPAAVAVRRLVDQRDFTEHDARARMARQASRTDRVALADLVIDNSGGIDDLHLQLDRAWSWIVDLRPSRQVAGPRPDPADPTEPEPSEHEPSEVGQ
jgi:dephospho-CoA kinase